MLKVEEEFGFRARDRLYEMCVSLDDIARVVQCKDDYSCVNVVTKDGKIHTINERYNDVVMKIRQAEGCEEDG